jgi:hypothetical protein
MADPIDSVRTKVLAIFQNAFGDLSERLDGSVLATPAMDAITEALEEEHGLERANQIAINMADWNWDAAFIVALHVFPEQFSKDEIDAGLGLFLCHAPNHIRKACLLTDTYVWEPDP